VRVSHDYFFQAIDRQAQLEAQKTGQDTAPQVKCVRFAPTLYAAYFNLSQQEDWAFDTVPAFDVVVIRTGEGLNTRYSLNPCPAKELSEADQKAIAEAKPLPEMVGEAVSKEDTPKGDDSLNVDQIPF